MSQNNVNSGCGQDVKPSLCSTHAYEAGLYYCINGS